MFVANYGFGRGGNGLEKYPKLRESIIGYKASLIALQEHLVGQNFTEEDKENYHIVEDKILQLAVLGRKSNFATLRSLHWSLSP